MALVIHNVTGAPTSTWHTAAQVRTVGGTWQNATIYSTPLGDFVNFSTDVDVEVKITYKSTANTATLSPARKGISVSRSGNDCTFTLSGADKNGYYVLQVNKAANVTVHNDQEDEDVNKRGNGWKPLVVFSNAPEATDYTVPGTIPAAGQQSTQTVGGMSTLCLGAGHWKVSNSTTIVTATSSEAGTNTAYSIGETAAGTTPPGLYLAPGAVLHGKIRFGQDVDPGTGRTSGKLFGRGIIDATFIPNPEGGRAVRVNHSSNIEVNGIIINNNRHWAFVSRKSRECNFKNIKVFSARKYWSGGSTGETKYGTPDGIDMVASHKVLVQNFFVRAYDDAITIKTDMPGSGFAGAGYDVTYDGGVIFQGWAGNAMEIGFETVHRTSSSVFKNIDVVAKLSRSDPYDRDAISINAHAAGPISGITYENIYVEECEERFIGLDASTANASINGVQFKNIVFNQGATDLPIYIGTNGLSGSGARVQNVSFVGLKFGGTGGTQITSAGQIDLEPATDAGRTGLSFKTLASGGGGGTPTLYQPAADVWVQGNGTQDGTGTELRVKNSSDTNLDRKSYLRFNLTGTADASGVNSAKLQLYVVSVDGRFDMSVYPVSDDTWTESMTWAGQPSNDNPIETVTLDTPMAGTWVEMDVTAWVNENLINGNDQISFLLYDSTVADQLAVFSSRQAASNKPKLSVL